MIDILRTLDEFEIYVDGELLDLGFHHDPHGEMHVIKKHVQIECDQDDEGECGKHLVIKTGDGDHEFTTWVTGTDEEVLLHEEIEITCTDDAEDGEEIDCERYMFVTTGDADIDIESLHEEHVDGNAHKVIVITKEVDSND